MPHANLHVGGPGLHVHFPTKIHVVRITSEDNKLRSLVRNETTPPRCNDNRSQADAAEDREREWMNEAQSNQARLRKQAKLIEKMQLQAGALKFDDAETQ